MLEAALMKHAVESLGREAGLTPYGHKFNVEGPMTAPSGRIVQIRAVWMVRANGAPDLVTAYPL